MAIQKLKMKRLKEGCTLKIEVNPFVHGLLRDQFFYLLSEFDEEPAKLLARIVEPVELTYKEAQLKLCLAFIKEIEKVAEAENLLEDYEMEYEDSEDEASTKGPSEN
jgi:predicted DNA-binding antitoxin AbrB/MazE fold protein